MTINYQKVRGEIVFSKCHFRPTVNMQADGPTKRSGKCIGLLINTVCLLHINVCREKPRIICLGIFTFIIGLYICLDIGAKT